MSDIIKPMRCAIYTRKSTDEGLDMQFNSLDAQREAGEAFVASQRHRRWECLQTRYDDGGYSGGNVNRPALKGLLADIEAGKVDVVVVYKIDRLSRNIMDFGKLLTLFDKHHVEFASVTQDINTVSSSGRMMLNILMTFAQYEREIITERIRDKVAAAKRKGMHTGGIPPMGYVSDPSTHKLVVKEDEAATVRRIYADYLRLGSARDVAAGLEADGLRPRVITSRRGRVTGGGPFTPALIYAVLSNPLYIGKVRHYDKTYPGEQEAIIDQKTWDNVQRLLAENLRYDGKRQKRVTPLGGLVFCGCCGGPMKETFTARGSRRYRYFVCGRDEKRVYSTCSVKSVPADELEKLVVREIGSLLNTPETLAGILAEAGMALDAAATREALADLTNAWEVMFPVERYKFLRGIVSRVTVWSDKVAIRYNLDGLEQLVIGNIGERKQ